jgi:nucleoside-diphosphate-sugar epimerase
MTQRRRTILITGASGVVGRAVADEIRDRVVALVHGNPEVPEADEVIVGDLSAPHMGLEQTRWRALAEEVDAIVHSGALTEWGQPFGRYETINMQGTRNVIELARAAGAPVHFISTIFVLALIDSREALRADNLVRNYILSKLESERLLQDSGVPHTIFRPTNLVGDSRTGASTRPQIVQALSDFVCWGKAPYFPSHPGNLVDVAPLDALSIPVARVAETDGIEGTFFVSYGAEAMDVQATLDVLEAHARELGREIPHAEVVDPRQPLPVPLEELRGTVRPFVSVGIDVSEVTHASGGVLPSSLPELCERFDVPQAAAVDVFRRSLQYWAEQRGRKVLTTEAT